jgi:hypothetical protein
MSPQVLRIISKGSLLALECLDRRNDGGLEIVPDDTSTAEFAAVSNRNS